MELRQARLMSLSALLQITQELRDYAQQHQIDEELAAQVGMPGDCRTHCLSIITTSALMG